jgi:hypothetical protein
MMPVPQRRMPFKGVKAAGVARSVNLRSETFGQGASRQILTFRLEQYDDHGNRMTPIPVEMRVLSVMGQLSEGEQVMVKGRWRHGVLRTRRIHNLSTGAVITAPFRSRSVKWMVWPLGLAALVVVGILVSGVIRDGTDSISSNNPLDSVLSTPSVPGLPTGGPEPGPGSGPEPTTAPSTQVLPPPAPSQVMVGIKDYSLPTDAVLFTSGDELILVNEDPDPHDIEIRSLPGSPFTVPPHSQVSLGNVALSARTGGYVITCGTCNTDATHTNQTVLDVR